MIRNKKDMEMQSNEQTWYKSLFGIKAKNQVDKIDPVLNLKCESNKPSKSWFGKPEEK